MTRFAAPQRRTSSIPAGLFEAGQRYAGETDASDHGISPVYGSFTGFPPTTIIVGTADYLLEDSRRVTAAMRRDGVDVTLTEYSGAFHGFTMLAVPSRRPR